MKVLVAAFICFYSISFAAGNFLTGGKFDMNVDEILASVDDQIVTSYDVYSSAKINCFLKNKAKNQKELEACIDETKMESFQYLIHCFTEIAFLEKNKMSDIIEKNKINMDEYIKSIEKTTKITRVFAEKNNLDYDLFFKCNRAQFIVMILVNSMSGHKDGSKPSNKDLDAIGMELMKKMRAQVMLDIKD